MVEVVDIDAQQVLPVRIAAFSPLGVSPGGRSDGDDNEDTKYLGVMVDGELVAVSTLNGDASPRNSHTPVWRLRGMATLPNHQGHGYGGLLLQTYVDQIAALGGGLLWGDLRIYAVPFYERYGFVVQADEYKTSTGVVHRYGEVLVTG